jgi:hypothetical protein
MPRLVAVIVAVASLVLVGCAAQGPSGTVALPAPTPTMAPTDPPATPTPAPTPPPSVEPSGPLTVVDGDLAAGTYASTSLGLDIGFELDGGWRGFADIEDVGFALAREGIEGGVSVTNFGGGVFSDPCSPETTEMLDPTAEAFVAWLAEHPELDAADPIDVSLGGHPAIQIDLTSDVGEACPEFPRIWLWVLPVVGDFHLDEDEAARFIVADIGAQTVVVVIETFGMDGHEEHLALAQPVVASMTIEP